jgi:hypothetical protein
MLSTLVDGLVRNLTRGSSVEVLCLSRVRADSPNIWLLVECGAIAYDSIRGKLATLSVRFCGTELEFHAFTGGNCTVFSIKLLLRRTTRLHHGHTILVDLIMLGARWALRDLVSAALTTVELESFGALGINV